MKARIAPLGPGEELIDAEIFHALYSKISDELPRSSEPRTEPRRLPPPDKPKLSWSEVRASTKDVASRSAAVRPLRKGPHLPAPARPPSAATAAALEAEIDRSTHRLHVARLAVHLARAYVSAAALFRLHRGVIHGVCGEGVAHCGEQLLFPSDLTTPFAEVVASQKPVRCLAPQDGLGARVLAMLGRDSVQEIAVVPVVIQGRIVGLLYADNGAEALADASFAALQAVATRLAKAYERLILARKQDPLAPPALSTEGPAGARNGALAPPET